MKGALVGIHKKHKAAMAKYAIYRHGFRGFRIIGVAYLMILALGCICQKRMVYFPSREIHSTPLDFGMAYEEVELAVGKGDVVVGWWVPAEGARGTVLFCHGNAGNIADRCYSIGAFNRLGMNVFIFDYRGYGRSSGRPSESRTYEDALAAWSYLAETRGVEPGRIVIFGRSLGGSVAAWLAGRAEPGALILESTFTSAKHLGSELFPWLPIGLMVRMRYATAEYLRDVTCPVLIGHSSEDTLIKYHHGRDLFAAAREPKSFFEMRGDHNSGPQATGREYETALDDFLTIWFGRQTNLDNPRNSF